MPATTCGVAPCAGVWPGAGVGPSVASIVAVASEAATSSVASSAPAMSSRSGCSTCCGESITTICGTDVSLSRSHPTSVSSGQPDMSPGALCSCASMCPHSPGGGDLSLSSATIRSRSLGIANKAALFAQDAHRSGGTHSGAGTPSIVCSADLARSTASARPISERPRGESFEMSSGRCGTVESGNTSGPTESSSCARVKAESTTCRSPMRTKSVASK
mmetsp:Transcript_22449/g.68417  ORF Transcript_22449/g.68417 Transcript_22449/m.68417 type:complete len:218 (+) Transcript_22449:2293-2946(+)